MRVARLNANRHLTSIFDAPAAPQTDVRYSSERWIQCPRSDVRNARARLLAPSVPGEPLFVFAERLFAEESSSARSSLLLDGATRRGCRRRPATRVPACVPARTEKRSETCLFFLICTIVLLTSVRKYNDRVVISSAGYATIRK